MHNHHKVIKQVAQGSGKLDTKSLLNYTNNAVLALQGGISGKDKKTAQDNLLKIQELLQKAEPNIIILKPNEVVKP